MSKFDHSFSLLARTSSCALYGCGGLRARLDFVARDIVRVAVFTDGERLLPTYSVCPDGKMPREGRDKLSTDGFEMYVPEVNGDEYRLDGVTLKVARDNLLLSFSVGCKTLLCDRAPLAYNLEGELGDGARHYVSREQGERIYGLGDKGGETDKSGRRFRVECFDAMGYDGARGDPFYKHVPFYICQNSVGSYGLFYDTHADCAFDFGAEISNYYGGYKYFSCADTPLVYYVFFGSVAHITASFNRLCGGTAFAPRDTLYYAGSSMSYTDAPDADARLRDFADECARRGFECRGFYLSSGYTSIGDRRYVFNWNTEKFPDPKGLARLLDEDGIKLIANIKPVFLTDHPMYAELAQKGYFLKYPDGSPAKAMFWDGLGSYLDFTNPDAYDFWRAQVEEKLLENGIAYTWNDNNEYELADADITACGFGNPFPARLMRPAFSSLMTMSSAQAQQNGKTRQFLSTRCMCAGASRIAATWTGDNRTAFSTLRDNHRMGMTQSLSGIYNFGHDIGGFAGGAPSGELLMRWLQHGVFMPRFVVHSWNPDGTATTPWLYPEHEGAARAIFALRRRLVPYIYDALYRAHTRFSPIVSPLFTAFPDADVESDCFMLSDGVLAACVYDEGARSVTVPLPANEGGWYREGQNFEGEITVQNAPDDLPVWFYRAGSVFVEDVSEYGAKQPEKLRYTVFAKPKGEFTRELFWDDGESFGYIENDCTKLQFTVRCDDKVYVNVKNLGNIAVNFEVCVCDSLGRKTVVTFEKD